MRIYEVQKNGKAFAFARTAGYARDYVREDDPSARKTPQSIAGVDIFTNGMSITVIEIKPDKEGVISKLNSLIVQEPIKEPVEKTTEQVVIKTALSGSLFPASKEVKEVENDYVNAGDTGYVGIIPATEYKVDELNFPKKGKGRCLHCKKLVGYVGGFPAVNPPDAICD